MKKIFVAILAFSILSACVSKQPAVELTLEQRAYNYCITIEPDVESCLYKYVRYLPENYERWLENK